MGRLIAVVENGVWTTILPAKTTIATWSIPAATSSGSPPTSGKPYDWLKHYPQPMQDEQET